MSKKTMVLDDSDTDMTRASDDLDEAEDTPAGADLDASESLGDDEIIDFITDAPVKVRGNESVRQQIARAMFKEYGISVDDMERDFPIPVEVDGRRRGTKRADIAVFAPGSEHSLANLQRVVICKPEPKAGRAVTKIRTHTQAEKDLDELKDLLGTHMTPQAQYGLWTNGLDFFFLYRELTRFGMGFEPRADWPVQAGSRPPWGWPHPGRLETRHRPCTWPTGWNAISAPIRTCRR